MTDEQIKAAKSLKRALTKCQKARLQLQALKDVGLYVLPVDVAPEEFREAEASYQSGFPAYLERVGINVEPVAFRWDAGAGV